MVHEIGVACPKCRTSDPAATMLRDGQAQTRSPYCVNCNGDGWLFRSPVLVRGLATSIRQRKTVEDIGLTQPGDMQFSIGPGFISCGTSGRRVARGDKFTATWSQPLDDGQTLVRGAANAQENVRLRPNVKADEDRLWYEPDAALWCEDADGVVYTGADFILGPGKVIQWVGNQPNAGVKYTLKYTAFFEWLAFEPPQERVDRDNADMGPLVSLRRRHIAFINDSPYVSDDDRIPLSQRVGC